jgi:demethylmenaquinone methyltransferase/2-methoxy-6-polyprenyl-1,4-benzoquinol methylase
MFSKIAHRYDLLNHVLSLNIDRHWRRHLVRSAVLDACTGTADVAIGFAREHPDCTVVGLDRSSGMLSIGREKLARNGLNGRVNLEEGDVLEMPFADGEFDAVSIAFGLRNLPDYARGVSEMVRVLKPGGKLLILEFAPPERGLYLKGYNFYLQNVIPMVGGLISGSWKAYRYLASSIGDFLPRGRILDLMRDANLADVTARKMAGGVTYLFRGERR